jgi:predicted enzyme related to lactoylglutathione lyase
MKPQLNAITIAVKDIVKLKRFYVELFEWKIMDENPDIVMFRLDHITLTLYKEKDHAKYLDLQ